DPIRIGNSSPLTGALAYQGEQEQNGIRLAIQEINAKGGVLGRPLEVVSEDNKCNPTEAVSAASRLLERRVSVLLGAHCSSATIASMPLVQNAKIPLVTPISTNPKITEATGKDGNDWVFRLNPSDAMLADAIGAYISEAGTIKKVAIVAEDTDYGRGGADALRKKAESAGIAIISVDHFPLQQPDFTPILTRIQLRGAEAVAIYMSLPDQLNFFRQFQQVGGKAKFTGRVELGGKHLPDLLKSGVLEGASSVFPYSPQLDTPENNRFVATFKQRFGEEPIYAAAASYEAVYVIADAIRRAGASDPAAIQAALKKTNYKSMLGIDISFDEKNQAHNVAIILQVKDGRVQVVSLRRT
ncbi:MAG TPA: ABC transporter substrate-binding protein, partial [Nitrospiraceae bacterium]|nr:ABC transporter substrate-binding protein [Nitrospiraceae bacterium]